MKYSERKKRLRQAVSSADLISSVINGYDIADELRVHRLVCEWPEIVGPRVASRSKPDGLHDKTLWVRVSSSAWMQELSFVKADIVAAIHRQLGEPRLVNQLRLHLGQTQNLRDDPLAGVVRPRPRPPVRRLEPAQVSSETLEQIDRELSAVEDDEIREAISDARKRWGI